MLDNDVKIVTLDSENEIDAFLEYIGEYRVSGTNFHDCLVNIISEVGFPCTIICEYNYVDKIYRDTFYSYFAGKHYNYERNCKRLSVFQGDIDAEVFFKYDEKTECMLQKSLVGTMVIKPIETGRLGRTLLDPSKLHIDSAFLRLTSYSVVIVGHRFNIEAFPFSSQDAETMTCAETTVWCILEYYGTQYSEYKTVLPSDIYREVCEVSSERVWPSKGLTYEVVSDLLKTFGFSPRLYALKSFAGTNSKKAFEDSIEYRRIFHYYVESGIPFAVGIATEGENPIGHSMVCIGHGAKRKNVEHISKVYIDNIPYVDSADYCCDYVMIDDNRCPYSIDDYKNISLYENSFVDVIAVPLYKRIMMEACDARSIVEELLRFEGYNFNAFLFEQEECMVNDDNPVVVRLLLTSSRKYKSFRAKNAHCINESKFYSSIVYPKFLWLAEISTQSKYEQNKILGEIVLDATAAITGYVSSYENSVILLRYFNHIGYSYKEGKEIYENEKGEQFETYLSRFDMMLDNLEYVKEGFHTEFTLYENNLKNI